MTITAVRVPFVDLAAQLAGIREEIEGALRRVLDSSAYVLGPEVARFEEEFAAFVEAKHAVGVANGTDALWLSLRAAGVGEGDDVMVPANTFVATAEAVVHAGARPVFIDVDARTYTLDVARLEDALTPRTRAIIPVHLFGQPAAMEPILAFAGRHGLCVIEDAAQAHGARYQGKRVGALGHAGCFSFYPVKNLGGYGDGGAVVTNSADVARTVRKLRDHGGERKYQHDVIGHNSRLDALQAAVLRVKLRHLDAWNARRRAHAHRYDALLSPVPGVRTPAVAAGVDHVYHLYVIRITADHRRSLQDHLQTCGIHTLVHYPTPPHLTDAFKPFRPVHTSLPVAELAAQEMLSLPMYPELEESQIAHVVGRITDYLSMRPPEHTRGVGT